MSQPHLTFRDATAADIPALLALIQSAYRGEASRKGWTTEADLVEGERIDEPGLLEKISEPNGVVMVVTVEGTDDVVSCCEFLHRSGASSSSTTTETTTEKQQQVGYFGLFAVDPNRQAGGIGRRVLEHAEREAARRWGVTTMEMTVIAARADIIAWYERRGYAQSTTEPTRPFPHEMVARMRGGRVLRDDLHFVVLEKAL
ncbi:acyl-CoA N-acyltransferase [Microdochium trichocladiopsis]|uniref:Acyl-CoA N-acyltransferase n=1 Tax=Microdochium trichocladiopsis TaxID=1682393 RepID=A0A9P8Y1A5_9PEZI|nr:acyl-CoA N-acyltransferase [Microdochium trichocladiopsis]KAH7024997.1 acyl-CoA N-acyltransferase [Microdochium trichocladiopsis]